jgi:hypothetical protein
MIVTFHDVVETMYAETPDRPTRLPPMMSMGLMCRYSS